MEKVTDLTARLAAPIVEEQGCSLWDVEYVKEAGTWYLRVLIDKEGGVDILDCENISRALSDLLDEAESHRRQLYLRGRLRRRRAGAEASRRLPAVSEQPRAGEALQAGGRPQGIPRHPDRLQRGRRFSHRGPQRHALYFGKKDVALCPPAGGILICYPCLKKRRIK